MSLLHVKNVSKSFQKPVLDNVTLTINPLETVALLGSSGSGKSTLLNIIAGLESSDSGVVEINARPIHRGQLAYMQQKDLLLEFLTVFDNIALPLKIKQIDKSIIQTKVEELLHFFKLSDYKDYYSHQLSGGMKQRVALCRTIIQDLPIVLLDEPFSALDAMTRYQLQEWYRKTAKQYQLTTLLVTHDIDEALRMSQRILLLKDGEIALELVVDQSSDYLMSQRYLDDKQIILKYLLY